MRNGIVVTAIFIGMVCMGTFMVLRAWNISESEVVAEEVDGAHIAVPLRYIDFSGIQVIQVGEKKHLGFPLAVQVRSDYLKLEKNNFVRVNVSEFADHQRYWVSDDVYEGLSNKLASTE